MSEKGRKISKDLETVYVVTKDFDPTYKRTWKKATLRANCRSVYGITLAEFLHVHKRNYKGYRITQLLDKPSLV